MAFLDNIRSATGLAKQHFGNTGKGVFGPKFLSNINLKSFKSDIRSSRMNRVMPTRMLGSSTAPKPFSVKAIFKDVAMKPIQPSVLKPLKP
jgi:hypothetical protein